MKNEEFQFWTYYLPLDHGRILSLWPEWQLLKDWLACDCQQPRWDMWGKIFLTLLPKIKKWVWTTQQMRSNYSFLREKVPSENDHKKVEGVDELCSIFYPNNPIATSKLISKNHSNGSRTILTLLSLVQWWSQLTFTGETETQLSLLYSKVHWGLSEPVIKIIIKTRLKTKNEEK